MIIKIKQFSNTFFLTNQLPKNSPKQRIRQKNKFYNKKNDKRHIIKYNKIKLSHSFKFEVCVRFELDGVSVHFVFGCIVMHFIAIFAELEKELKARRKIVHRWKEEWRNWSQFYMQKLRDYI